MNSVRRNLVLSVLSGVLLSIPYLVPHTGLIMLFAFLPLLWMEHAFTVNKQRGCWKYYAVTFLIWNVLTVFWISYITVAGGILAILGNSFQMFAVFAIFRCVKKRLLLKGKRDVPAYVFLAAFWVAWEFFYFDAEISFPWLVLGNGFATNVSLVQWYEVTGSLGGSLWIWTVNLLLFYSLRDRLRGWITVLSAMVLFVPIILSLIRFYTYRELVRPVEVVVVQPNIDPVNDKFRAMPQHQQDAKILSLALEQISPNTTYVVAPETSIPEVILGNYYSAPSMILYKQFVEENPQTAFVFGANTIGFYPPSPRKPTASSRSFKDYWYEVYNSAIQLDTTDHVQVYHKSKLVVGSEKMPYIDKFPFIEKLSLNLGGISGTLGTQSERTVFTRKDNKASIGVAICYESIYGEFFTEYVKNGANIMAVITNDGWWGNTPGYRQHVSYASLRAIETRRCIAHSANTGISALIDQKGVRLVQTKWWVPGSIKGTLNLNDSLTPYVKYGDYLGWVSIVLMAVMGLYSLICALPLRRRA
ncbi:MAG: apolipoprotein N-acyltransferase [Bacteroidales bacterium]|jgi:apolipoprotein N-acyltransferase|nr:apolipoprotein N-acyltransferase [Bacteroidales bacterium]MDD2264048.1 apolipoprotein N-acyltransferase [Bacteroidales bacterium]MDD2831282.1 apolipoprotein N-acyltransferase [Bacteroidales bacterium]MDD3208605.1 apolipoprotein N-acyltransferase [Bacteroidales bacterium]MDD3697168.1 apolipoprotein N-acyltransferase [Bacteroidales bacterium]